MSLEKNWKAPLAANTSVAVTLSRFQDMDQRSACGTRQLAIPASAYRAYYDAYVQSRLAQETAQVERAMAVLRRVDEIGWTPEPLEIGAPRVPHPPNGRDPRLLLGNARDILQQTLIQYAGGKPAGKSARVGRSLVPKHPHAVSVDRYRGEAVVRGTNLETLDYPVSDAPWLLAKISEIMREPDTTKQLAGIQAIFESHGSWSGRIL